VKKGAIIGLGAVCFVVVFAIAVLALGGSGVDVVGNIVPYDCAKAWDEWRSHPRIADNDSFRKLSPDERKKIEGQYGRILDDFYANWCIKNHEEWQHRSADQDGWISLHNASDVEFLINWNDSIADEYEYNEKFPDGAYQDFPR